MRCDEARVLLLEADATDLDREGSSALSAHLRECPRCAAAAEDVLESMRVLSAHLNGPVPEGAVDAVLARLADEGATPVIPLVPTQRPTWRTSAWASLAMAAAVAGLFFVTRTSSPPPEGTRVAAAPLALPLVESSSTSSVALIETDNPDITVLWFF